MGDDSNDVPHDKAARWPVTDGPVATPSKVGADPLWRSLPPMCCLIIRRAR